MSTGELIFLFLLGLVVFGPKRLPEIGRQIGKLLNELRRASNEFKSQLEIEVNQLEAQTKKESAPAASEAPQAGAAKPLVMPPLPVPPSQMNEEQLEAARQHFAALNYGLTQPQEPPVSTTMLQPPTQPEPVAVGLPKPRQRRKKRQRLPPRGRAKGSRKHK